jgi:hypothetical protein
MTGVHVRAAFPSFQVLTHLNLVQSYICKECLVVFVLVSETVDQVSLNRYFGILVIGPSILVYILIENQQLHQMITILRRPIKCSYMFRRTNAIIRELI